MSKLVPWKPLIALITPDAEERSLLRAQLLGADYNVHPFSDPAGAIASLAEGMPHVVIVDSRQADPSRPDFFGLMKRLERVAPLPLLHVLDDADGGAVPQSLREGLDDTLRRPVNALELIARVGSLLRNRQLLGQVRVQEAFLQNAGIPSWRPAEGLPTVLLVEDEASERESIRRSLEGVPCRVLLAQDPSQALLHLKSNPPDLVIVDMLFPDLDGLEFCRYLKGRDETRNTPMLMLTSMPELDNRVVGMEVGPDDYLVKPAPHAEIVTRVRRLLARKEGSERLIGNLCALQARGLADPQTGIPGPEFFRFIYPETVAWAQRAQLPFTVARLRLAARDGFARLASAARSTLRNFDMVFATGPSDLSLILPETPTDRAQVALARVRSRAEALGFPPWELKIATVSIGEDGWDNGDIRDALRSKGVDPEERAVDRIVVVAEGDGERLVELLRAEGFAHVSTLPIEGGQKPRRIRARLVILQGDASRVPDMLSRVTPALSGPTTPVLIRYTGANGNGLGDLPIMTDYVPAGAGDDYFVHRVRRSLDLAQAEGGAKEVEQFLSRLIQLLEETDADMLGHASEVSTMAVRLGGVLGLPPDDREALRWGGLLHDVGKIFLPGRILNKPGLLSTEEFTVVKSHSRLGYDLCRAFTLLDQALPIIKHHHERMDGRGYPEGLRGEKIPLLARIVSVVDVFDTLTRRRPYRPALPPEEAARVLASEAESGLWDPSIVTPFLRMVGQPRESGKPV